MKKYGYNEITTMQYVFILSGTAISYGFIEIPSTLYKEAGPGGWITLILGALVTMGAGLVLVRLMKLSPDGTLMDLLAERIGRWAGVVAAVVVSLYFFYFAYVSLVYTTRVIKARILQETPAFLTLLLLLLPTYTIARNGFRVTGRYAELAVWLSVWIPVVFMLVWKHTHLLYLLPVAKDGWHPIVMGVPKTIFYFLGFFFTAVLHPFLLKKEKAAIGILSANLLTLLAYLFISILCFVFFSPNELKEINQPSIYMLKAVELPFIEQVEGLFIVMYLFIFSMSWIPAIQISAFCVGWIAGKADHRFYLRFILIAIALYSYFYVPGFNETYAMFEWLGRAGFGIEYALPVVLLCALSLAGRRLMKKSGRT